MKEMLKRFLRRITHKSLRSVVVAFCSGDEEVLSRISIDDVVARVEKFMDGMTPIHFIAFHFMILTVEFSVVPITRKIRPLRYLPIEKKVIYLDRWCESHFSLKRIIYIAMKYICMSQIYSEHALLESIGYGPDLQIRLGKKS